MTFLFHLIVAIVVLCVIIGFAEWLLGKIAFPAPLRWVVYLVYVLLFLVVLYVLLPYLGIHLPA